jgi:O-antigen ligase
MKLLISLFLFSLIFGQLGSVMVFPGVFVYIHDVFLIILVSVGLIKFFKLRKFKLGTLAGTILAYIFISIVSLFINVGHLPVSQLAAGSLYLWRWALYSLVYILVIQEYIKAEFWLKILYFAGCLFSLIGLIQYIFYPQLSNLQYLGWDPHYLRLFSTFLDPNFASLFIVLTILSGLFFWSEFPVWSNTLLIGLNLIALVLTYSRSGYLALFSGIALWTILLKKWRIFGVLIVFGLIFAVIPKSPLDVTRLDRTISSVARIDNWAKSWQLVEKSPVIGFGFNTLAYVKQNPFHTGTGGYISRAGAGVDNSMFFILATTGFVGLIAFGWLIAKIYLGGKRIIDKKKNQKVGVLLISSFSAVLIHSLFNNSLFYAWIMIWLWVLVGFCESYF